MKVEVHSRVRPEVKAALADRAATEGKTISAMIAKVLTATASRWATATKKEA